MAERFSAIDEGYELTDVELTNFEEIKMKINDINSEYKTFETADKTCSTKKLHSGQQTGQCDTKHKQKIKSILKESIDLLHLISEFVHNEATTQSTNRNSDKYTKNIETITNIQTKIPDLLPQINDDNFMSIKTKLDQFIEDKLKRINLQKNFESFNPFNSNAPGSFGGFARYRKRRHTKRKKTKRKHQKRKKTKKTRKNKSRRKHR